jgi:hypothetical protein
MNCWNMHIKERRPIFCAWERHGEPWDYLPSWVLKNEQVVVLEVILKLKVQRDLGMAKV